MKSPETTHLPIQARQKTTPRFRGAWQRLESHCKDFKVTGVVVPTYFFFLASTKARWWVVVYYLNLTKKQPQLQLLGWLWYLYLSRLTEPQGYSMYLLIW